MNKSIIDGNGQKSVVHKAVPEAPKTAPIKSKKKTVNDEGANYYKRYILHKDRNQVQVNAEADELDENCGETREVDEYGGRRNIADDGDDEENEADVMWQEAVMRSMDENDEEEDQVDGGDQDELETDRRKGNAAGNKRKAVVAKRKGKELRLSGMPSRQSSAVNQLAEDDAAVLIGPT